MPKSKKPFVERKKFKDGGDVEEFNTQSKNQVKLSNIPSLGTDEEDSPQLPAKELFRTFTNVYKEKTTDRDLQVLMAGLGVDAAMLGVDLVNMTNNQRNIMAQNLLAQYQTKLGDTDIQGRIVRPLNAPSGIYEMGANASKQLGQGRMFAGVNALKTPEDTRVLGYNIGYEGKVGPGFLNAGVNIPKGGPKPSARLNYRVPFKEGGLLQEGGTVDEESGNEVPTGSLKKEVRDDIPAQLSEGEFVFPADVVRFIGLQKLMEIRQAAKEGLAKMEAMGQMGNADEATEEDTGEFETELDDILDEIESESEGEDEKVKKPKGEQLKLAVGGAVSPQPNPFAVPFSVERYSKEGEKDIFIPTFGDQTQGAIPEGFQKSTKVKSFGGVFRKPEEAQQTVTSSLGTGKEAKAATSTPATTTDLTKTTQPIPDAYKDLDTDISKEKYLIDLAEKNAKQYTIENQAKGRAWGQGQVYNNPFANLTEFGTKKDNEVDAEGKLTGNTIDVNKTVYDYIAGAFPSAPDGKTIFDHGSTFLKVYKRDASGNPKEVSNPESLTLQEINSGDVLFQVGGKTGGANRERMAQVYQVVEDKLIPVGKASFYKGAHPDAELAMPIAMGAAFALAPFTGGASVAIGEAILGAGAVGAATLGSAVIGATVSGITAAATGGNVGKAMITGAVSGGIGANAMDITNAVLGPETVNSLSQATNLSAKQIASTFSSSISSGINTAIQGGDFSDIIKNFGQSLITSGVSEIAATNAMKTLSGTMDKQNLQRIGVATKMLSNVALNASLKGLDISKAIQYYAPTVMTRALTTPGGG